MASVIAAAFAVLLRGPVTRALGLGEGWANLGMGRPNLRERHPIPASACLTRSGFDGLVAQVRHGAVVLPNGKRPRGNPGAAKYVASMNPLCAVSG
ncbi:hypothetical protein [Methylobacterium sp. P1-11]|uniref:hypothetical protein n=1 Tax=Methylobacterium sp. P1-11 TaxID=2024616 RepID=UPI0011EDF088|nr:hypothetical protein [Methylobacterium sp. P1-11]